MDNFIIPPNPNWFMPDILHTSPNGVFFSAMTKIVYIPFPSPEVPGGPNIRIFDLKTKLFGFSLEPVDCTSFAIMSEDYCVCVFMLDSGKCVKGHKGHYNYNESKAHRISSAAVCYTRKNKIISAKHSDIISYCVLSNTYKCYSDISKKNPINILKDSPFSGEIAAGTKNGLILIFNEDFEVKFNLRGHDMEITALDWIKYVPEITEAPPITLPKSMFVDDSDAFDIYSFDELENEFGAHKDRPQDILSDEDANTSKVIEDPANSSKFNFMEACSNLKDTILGTPARGGDPSKTTFESNRELYGVPNENESDDSNISIASSHTPQLSESSINFIIEQENTPLKNDFVVIEKKDSTKSQAGITLLASGSKENYAWIWNIDQGLGISKVKWPGPLKSKYKSTLPTPFSSLVWMNQNSLFVTDSNGDLLEHKVTMKGKQIKVEKVNKKFFPKGILNICKSNDGKSIWTSSIHRQVFCLDIDDTNKILVKYDTLQLRIHFMIENPVDSNVIAIGGNDRRICLWNTSSAEKHQIALKPFMNKIHSAILCLSWHPKMENLLAFSTREGRIGLLDTNHSNNVPIIFRSFSSKEVYSIAWANFNNTSMLLACDSNCFVYYPEKGSSKFEPTEVPDLNKATSIFVHGEYLFIGTGNGNVLVCKNGFDIIFTIKVCKKYVGQITAFENTVVVCADNDIHCLELNSESQLVPKVNLLGHTSRACSVRFNKIGSMLVSSCFAGVIKIWDMSSHKILANYNLNTPAYSALFLPAGDDKIIVCGGQDSTVVTFDWTKHTGEFSITEKSQKPDGKSINWAKSAEIVTTIKSKRTKRKVDVHNGTDDIAAIAKDLQGIKLDREDAPKTNTLFPLSSKELSSNPMMVLQQMLEQSETLNYNQKMFAERDSVKQLIDDELSHYRDSGVTNTFGTIILPQLKDSSLRQEVVERIASKTLTDTHVAIAPTISFENCCEAYAMQCLENENHLKAIPYLLAIDKVDTTIETLCSKNYFREAWIVAKMRKDGEDIIFANILTRWTHYFEQNGFFEAAAVLFVCAGDYKNAIEVLNRRKAQSEIFKTVLDLLNQKIEE